LAHQRSLSINYVEASEARSPSILLKPPVETTHMSLKLREIHIRGDVETRQGKLRQYRSEAAPKIHERSLKPGVTRHCHDIRIHGLRIAERICERPYPSAQGGFESHLALGDLSIG
jgi:hypothetical protein